MATKEDVKSKNIDDITFHRKYAVYLLNDDYTTMDFVVDVLVGIFNKSFEEAKELMLTIHTKGEALCGVYSHEIAETKVSQVSLYARENNFPLKAVIKER